MQQNTPGKVFLLFLGFLLYQEIQVNALAGGEPQAAAFQDQTGGRHPHPTPCKGKNELIRL